MCDNITSKKNNNTSFFSQQVNVSDNKITDLGESLLIIDNLFNNCQKQTKFADNNPFRFIGDINISEITSMPNDNFVLDRSNHIKNPVIDLTNDDDNFPNKKRKISEYPKYNMDRKKIKCRVVKITDNFKNQLSQINFLSNLFINYANEIQNIISDI